MSAGMILSRSRTKRLQRCLMVKQELHGLFLIVWAKESMTKITTGLFAWLTMLFSMEKFLSSWGIKSSRNLLLIQQSMVWTEFLQSRRKRSRAIIKFWRTSNARECALKWWQSNRRMQTLFFKTETSPTKRPSFRKRLVRNRKSTRIRKLKKKLLQRAIKLHLQTKNQMRRRVTSQTMNVLLELFNQNTKLSIPSPSI